jgi:hypothetical protein
MNCTKTCPKGLNPAKAIAEIKKLKRRDLASFAGAYPGKLIHLTCVRMSLTLHRVCSVAILRIRDTDHAWRTFSVHSGLHDR